MEYIIEGFKKICAKPQDSLEGYLLMSDNKQNKSLFFVKDNDKCWKTTWLDNSIKVNKPSESIETVFTKH
jgi:hypothetical protein